MVQLVGCQNQEVGSISSHLTMKSLSSHINPGQVAYTCASLTKTNN